MDVFVVFVTELLGEAIDDYHFQQGQADNLYPRARACSTV